MVSGTSDVLSRLLAADTAASRDAAWADLLASYSRLLLHVARSLGGDHDAVMDRYTRVLEELRRDDHRRLRAFIADGRSEFSTWLVVVAQRICLDHHRHRYGRSREGTSGGGEDAELAARRRLVDLIGASIELDSLVDGQNPGAADALAVADLYRALGAGMTRLRPADRLLIKLRFEDDLPMPEIARQLGFRSRFHAYRRLTHVLTELREALRHQGIHDAIA